MQRKVYLVGELGEKFGSSFTVHASSYSEVFKCLEANHPTFKKYLLDSQEKGVGFTVETAGKFVQEDRELLLPLNTGDITIAALPAGSKSGGMKIFAAMALFFILGPMAAQAAAASGAATTAASLTAAAGVGGASVTVGTFMGLTAAQITTAVGTMSLNLALTGLQQLMAPDPSVDAASPTNYLFNGAQQNVVDGDPIPLLYGELIVPGRPISLEISQNTHGSNNVFTDWTGNVVTGGGGGTMPLFPPPTTPYKEADFED
jgi:predicted phage tail protein